MPDVHHRDYGCLLNILESITKIQSYSNGFYSADDFFNHSISFDASMMNFIIIGEMVEKLSEEFIEKNPIQSNWFKIKGFRNILAHNYFGIDAEEVWQIINNKLPVLKQEIMNIIELKNHSI